MIGKRLSRIASCLSTDSISLSKDTSRSFLVVEIAVHMVHLCASGRELCTQCLNALMQNRRLRRR
jgi:hypothetical protein